MPIRIVGHGKGYDTQVLDAETGQDLTSLLQVSAIALDCKSAPTAQLTAWLPQVDVVVQEATLLQRCPYCGHERIRKIHGASDLGPVNRRLVVSARDLDDSFLELSQVPHLSEGGV